MTALKLLEPISVEEYLEGEKVSPVKHEYVHGRVFAFAGASDAHNRIVVNLIARLYAASEGKGCRLYANDMKVRALGDRFYYPDVMVVCDPSDKGEFVKENPCLIVEVLSRSTASTDRREKVDAYLSLPTLGAYIMVDSRTKRVEAFFRTPEGWLERHFSGSGEVPFEPLDTSLSLDAIYTGLTLPDTSTEEG